MRLVIETTNSRSLSKSRASALSRGLCQFCAKEPHLPGLKVGENCREYFKKKSKAWRLRKKPVIIGWSGPQ